MTEISPLDESTGQPPVVHVVRLTRALGLRLTVYGTALFYVAVLIVLSFDTAGSHPIDSVAAFGRSAAIAMVTIAATFAAHEAVHGFFIRLYGGHPRFGVGSIGWVMPYAYAVSPASPFTLRQMTIICLAPFVLISGLTLSMLAFLPAAFGFAAVAFIGNFSGSVGDLWMVGRLWRFRQCRNLRFVDSLDSMMVHTSDARGSAIAAALASPEQGRLMGRLLLRWILLTSIVLTAVIPFGILLSVLNAPDLVVGPVQFPLARYGTMGGQGLSIDVNAPAIVLTALVAAVLSLPLRGIPREEPPAEAPPAAPRPAFL